MSRVRIAVGKSEPGGGYKEVTEKTQAVKRALAACGMYIEPALEEYPWNRAASAFFRSYPDSLKDTRAGVGGASQYQRAGS